MFERVIIYVLKYGLFIKLIFMNSSEHGNTSKNRIIMDSVVKYKIKSKVLSFNF